MDVKGFDWCWESEFISISISVLLSPADFCSTVSKGKVTGKAGKEENTRFKVVSIIKAVNNLLKDLWVKGLLSEMYSSKKFCTCKSSKCANKYSLRLRI